MDILFVSADDNFSEGLIRSIAAADRQISRVHSAEAAIPIITSGTFNAVIADDPLTGMSGIDLLEQVRPMLDPACKFILISNVSDGRVVLDYIKRGLRDFVIRGDRSAAEVTAILESREDRLLFPD
ncbi:MAG: hypothetical protein ACKORJ_01045 [Bacteroidota bacterium]